MRILRQQPQVDAFGRGGHQDRTSDGRGAAGLDCPLVDILGFSSSTTIVSSIAPAGNERIDSGAILRKIATKPGDFYSPDNLRKDLKTVFSMGYFDNVEIEVNDSSTGKEVIFRVQEKPLISNITSAGIDELSETDVSEAANIQPNTIFFAL